jgi:hypothetical protein
MIISQTAAIAAVHSRQKVGPVSASVATDTGAPAATGSTGGAVGSIEGSGEALGVGRGTSVVGFAFATPAQRPGSASCRRKIARSAPRATRDVSAGEEKDPNVCGEACLSERPVVVPSPTRFLKPDSWRVSVARRVDERFSLGLFRAAFFRSYSNKVSGPLGQSAWASF